MLDAENPTENTAADTSPDREAENVPAICRCHARKVPAASSTGPAWAMSSALPSGIPSAMSNRTMSPSSRIAAKWASVPPIIPAPISAILRRAMKAGPLDYVKAAPDGRFGSRRSKPASPRGQPPWN